VLQGQFVDGTERFILCTSYSLGDTARQEAALSEIRKKLIELGIRFEVWDSVGLSSLFRKGSLDQRYVAIVHRYFGEDIAKAFYGDVWLNYLKRLEKIPKRRYDFIEGHIDRTVSDISRSEKSCRLSLPHVLENKEVKGRGNKLALLSGAGYGKSTELRQTVAYFSQDTKYFHPILFCLRDYNGQGVLE